MSYKWIRWLLARPLRALGGGYRAVFPECVARVPVSHWGSGGEAVFAKFCVCDRNRSQPFATVRNRPRYRRKALHSGECVWSGPESVSS